MSAILNNPVNPIIPWLGGKRRLAYRLIPLFPPHECYVELFCGGSALYFLRPVPAPVEVLNDINGELVKPNYNVQMVRALFGESEYERFKAAGGK